MNIYEPMTFITDIILSCASLFFYFRLRGRNNSYHPMVILFLPIALASLCGGLYHGFFSQATAELGEAIWILTLIFLSLASTLLLSFFAASLFDNFIIKILVWLKFAFMIATYTFVSQEFLYAIADYGTAYFVGFLVCIFNANLPVAFRKHFQISFIVSVAAAIVQQSSLRISTFLNANDIYHMIQLAGLFFLYRSILILISVDKKNF